MKYFIAFLCFAGLPAFLWSQNAVLRGQVTDSKTHQPLVGVTVVLGNGQGAITGDNGNYLIRQVEAGEQLVKFTSPGYETIEQSLTLNATGNTDLNIELKSGNIELKEVTVQAFGTHQSRPITQLDIRLRPVLNSQEILRMVPGLFMGQHAGGGKAEQIFLRGFDIDHGTDIQLTVDGMPVNMVSHAHGQGYADLHFVIPELVEQVQFEKGPYRADKGNFVTAGWVDFRTRSVLDKSFAKLEVGQYGTYRGVAAVNLLGEKARNNNQSAYLAGEYSYSDSYFDAPQFFNRANVQGRYNGEIGAATRLTLTGSHFWSRWNHSGQIPDRSVDAGDISFFGFIDPTEGGETSRTNFNAQFLTQTSNGGVLKNQLFYSNYNFELFSNFTFFLEDSINGDQIKQKERRNLLGYNSSYQVPNYIGDMKGQATMGIQFRQDFARDVELSNTMNRTIVEQQIQLGDIEESNIGFFVNEELAVGRHLNVEIGMRYDHFFNAYTNALENNSQAKANAGIVSPKINIAYSPNDRYQFYLHTGRGFHSNDTRVVTQQNGREILPPAYGSDLGLVWKPLPRLYVNAALWYLWLQQEFVYVGDAGVVEPSGRTQRYGVDLSARYQLTKHLFADIDLNWTRPRAIDEPSGQNLIPLAPIFTTVGGLSVTGFKGFSGSLRYRYLADRAANEDNSLVAKGYFVPDLQVNYTRKKWELGLNVQNLINTRWKETQFATESRLQNEPEPVEEIHFTPGTPFFTRLSLTVFF
jgi:hypothetical protein